MIIDQIKLSTSITFQDIRLLYGGKILNDIDTLGEHLKASSYMEYGDVFTIHLSCSVPSQHHERESIAEPETMPSPESGVSPDYQHGYGYPSWQTMYSYYNGQEFLHGTDDNQV